MYLTGSRNLSSLLLFLSLTSAFKLPTSSLTPLSPTPTPSLAPITHTLITSTTTTNGIGIYGSNGQLTHIDIATTETLTSLWEEVEPTSFPVTIVTTIIHDITSEYRFTEGTVSETYKALPTVYTRWGFGVRSAGPLL